MTHPRRFFVNPTSINGQSCTITGSEAHHLCSVLRLTNGHAITLLDGTGATYQAVVESSSPDRVEAIILGKSWQDDVDAPFHLGIGLLEGKKMALVIQKATELGVTSLHPFTSRFSMQDHHAGPGRENRWQRVILETCKQCGRPAPPDCEPVQNFSEVINAAGPCQLKLLFWEEEVDRGLADISLTAGPHPLFVLIGPKGGFSAEEVAQAESAGFLIVSLGNRIIRAETAAIAAISIIQYRRGNLDVARKSCGQ